MIPAYRQFIEQVDRLAARLSSQYARHLACRAGCSGCCHHHLSVFAVEAAAVREAIEALPKETGAAIEQQAREVIEREAGNQPVACPLLVEDRCSIYESRPLICRTQGLPLLLEAEDGEAEIDFCPLNFTAPDAIDDLTQATDVANFVPLDDLNLKLALVNLQFCREQGILDKSSGQRQQMAEIILENLKSQI
ncbi:MAG: YkgJ family cysteine cluster protein [Acidobacteriota bacterium]